MIEATEPGRDAAVDIAVASGRKSPARRLVRLLGLAGYAARPCECLDQLLQHLSETGLVVLDPRFPPRGGLVACEAIRAVSTVPIIVTGRRLEEEERIALLEHGADSVLEWPIGEMELLARVRALLRRRGLQRPVRQIALGAGRVLDLDDGAILINGQALALTPTEARLMRALASRLGNPYPVRELVEAVWGRSYLAANQTDIIRANIYRLRRKLEVDPREPRLLTFVPTRGWVLRKLPDPVSNARGASPLLPVEAAS